MKTLLTSGQVAKCIGVSTKTVINWYNKKMIEGIMLPGSTHRRFELEEIKAFCERSGLQFEEDHPCLRRTRRT